MALLGASAVLVTVAVSSPATPLGVFTPLVVADAATCDVSRGLPSVIPSVGHVFTPQTGVSKGYRSGCVTLRGESALVFSNEDIAFHTPTNDPGSVELRGTCFKFPGMMVPGANWYVNFDWDGETLKVSQNAGQTWRTCEPTHVYPDGTALIRYGCRTHFTEGALGAILLVPG